MYDLSELAPSFYSNDDDFGESIIEVSFLIHQISDIPQRIPVTTPQKILTEVNEALFRMDVEIGQVFKALKEAFSKRFPELESFNPSPLDYSRIVLAASTEDLAKVNYRAILPTTLAMVVSVAAATSAGRSFEEGDAAKATFLAKSLVWMCEQRDKVLEFIQLQMTAIAPNVSAIVGTAIASQLLGATGGIVALSRIPAGNIQVIGATRRSNLAGLSLAMAQPHAGFISDCDLVLKRPPEMRVKAQRLVAAKVALAARIDATSAKSNANGESGQKMRAEIEAKLDKLAEPIPISAPRPIPPPPTASTKKRGGRRARKEKEMYAMTALRKLQNRVTFAGDAEKETIFGDSVEGLGMLGQANSAAVGGGRLRLPAPVKRQMQVGKPRVQGKNFSSKAILEGGGFTTESIQKSRIADDTITKGNPPHTTSLFNTLNMSFRKN